MQLGPDTMTESEKSVQKKIFKNFTFMVEKIKVDTYLKSDKKTAHCFSNLVVLLTPWKNESVGKSVRHLTVVILYCLLITSVMLNAPRLLTVGEILVLHFHLTLYVTELLKSGAFSLQCQKRGKF